MRQFTQEHRAKLSAAKQGKKLSPEHKEKLREGRIRYLTEVEEINDLRKKIAELERFNRFMMTLLDANEKKKLAEFK